MDGSQKESGQTGSFDFFHDRALDAFSKGKLAEAESLCLKARTLQPDHIGALNLLGQVYLGQQRPIEAVDTFSRAVTLGTPRPNLYFNLALAYQAAGKISEALASVRTAIALDPTVPILQAKLGQLLLLANAAQEAVVVLRHAVQLDPKSVPPRLNLAQALTDLGEVSLAEKVTREALSLNPRDATAHRMLGRIHQQKGQFEEATKSFQTAIQIQPNQVAAYFALAYSKKLTLKDQGFIQRMESLTKVPQLIEADRSLIHYALGKAFDDCGDYVPAADHFALANRLALSARGANFDPELEAAQIEKIIELFPSGIFDRYPKIGSSSRRPIFIIGMIRSGTTLVEQILSRHPDVFAGGELRYWTDNEPRFLLEMMDSATPDIGAWIHGYEAELNRISKSSPHVTDKMPLNFWATGLIHLAYPNAKIIHCRRNPLDNCLSVYVTPFRHAPSFGHDVTTIATGYRQYLHLMEHWRSILPTSTMIDLDYEELVANPQTNIRKMVEFCELEWNEVCLDATANKQGVNTPSQWQVRQPLYRQSVNRWEHYRTLLEPIIESF